MSGVNQPPIRTARGWIANGLAFVITVALSLVASSPFLDWPLWAYLLVTAPITLVIAVVVCAIVAHLLRPWYRPGPKVTQRTEDQL